MKEQPTHSEPNALMVKTGNVRRGRLKVFLGMSPGVGKTYEMLRAARRRKAEGGDVVIGVVETHGRRETEALLRGLEILSRRPIDYRDRSFLEFDIDAALARKPALLLIDEYAHSNVPGSRHPKRWQDVQEVLAVGIDVWTTLNVQHLESLVDVVWKITGVRQRETVPDSALSNADEIEVVDITPSELRQRLAAGKVYVPETAQLASEKFFKPENLTALRELALRRAAQTIDDQLMGEMKRAGVEGPWAAGERILVLIGADTMAHSLIRAARRLSDMMMNAPWTVAHVEIANRAPPDTVSVARLNEAFKLAEQLGGSTVVLTGNDLIDSAFAYARQSNITQIMVGKSRRVWWWKWRNRSLAHALLDKATGVALHVITEAAPDHLMPPVPPARPVQNRWSDYVLGIGLVAAATFLSYFLDRAFEHTDLGMIFLSAVLAVGVLFGLRPALVAATLAFLTYNFLFLDPRYSFAIGSPTDVLTLLVFLAVALATGGLAGRVRDQASATARRASAISALLAASRRLSAVSTKDEAAKALAEQVSAAARGKAVVLLPIAETIAPAATASTTTPLSTADMGTADMAAARWAWEKGESAGAGTGTLPNAAWTFRPLQGLRTRSGVVGIEAKATSQEDERFVAALLDQGAVALERAELAAKAAEAEAWKRSDQLRSALLNSISHDLRTPLSTVLGSATTLIDYGKTLDSAVSVDLLESIREEAERLNRYVGNLLNMTRLEGGALNPRSEWTDVRDVLNAAAQRVSRRLGKRKLVTDYPPTLSPITTDAALLEQAVVNILENAIAYSPDDTDVEIAVYEDPRNIVISIEDEGRGIPTAELSRVFEKFRRMEEISDRGKGVGLGLSISKGFVDAMGGRIAAASPIHGDKGTRVLISLPKMAVIPQGST
ncbi:sensor histidine kinase [Beijerinckia indica]|uniref:histidine kinase n=1 Tax=Beijerinckia indica subsp. indica (strain ATCC 9039 / DSM 1715 / NCIMB 8712) TaxID=395963 RepID=B2IIP8_BEII9|nr:sensor histidine kinase KdpD [Beijerinckia indica]ACB94741.1 osmosensitive K+ channel signal transduction histidine kinase [Beijerinckia indica subsp. indica ATCC 9039]